MPLYEYECDACGHRFEVIQKFSDAPVDVCPKCGGPVQQAAVVAGDSVQGHPACTSPTTRQRQSRATSSGKDARDVEVRRRQERIVGGDVEGGRRATSKSDTKTGERRRRRDKLADRPRRVADARRLARRTAPVRVERLRGTRGRARPGRAAAARSRPSPSGSPACCRCRGGRRRPRRRRAAALQQLRAGRWSAGSRRCGRCRSRRAPRRCRASGCSGR